MFSSDSIDSGDLDFGFHIVTTDDLADHAEWSQDLNDFTDDLGL